MIQKCKLNFGEQNAFLIKNDKSQYDKISYNKFASDIDALGTALIDLDLKGKFIALIGENRYEWCLSYLSDVNGTGNIVPLDKELPFNELKNLLDRSNAEAIIFSSHVNIDYDELKSSLPNLKYLINMDTEDNTEKVLSLKKLIDKGYTLLEQGNTNFITAEIHNTEINILLFTSGTTEKSKAVMLSHKNVASNIMSVCQTIYADSKDTYLSVLPLHHTYECTCGFLVMVYLGVQIGFCEGLKHLSKNFGQIKPSIVMAVPLLLENIYNKVVKKAKKEKKYNKLKAAIIFSSILYKFFGIDIRRKLFKDIYNSLGGNLRLIISGAAALNPKVSKGLRAMGLNIMQGYGLTECSPIVSVNRMDYYNDGSAGIALPEVEIKIDNPDENNIGEILVKGPNVMLGYYNDEDATKKVFDGEWFYTGDYGYIDKKGFLFISGRKKNVIVTKNGKNIFPEDVELYLNKSNYILESIVYGVDRHDCEETIVCAQIVPNKEVIYEHFGRKLNQDEIYEVIKLEVKKANKKLTHYKRIKEFTVRENEFEKTTTKKIKRYIEMLPIKNIQKAVKNTVDGMLDKVEEVKEKIGR